MKSKSIGAAAIVLFACSPMESQTLEPAHVVPVLLVTPAYPPIAASARVSGDVTVVVRVLPDGSISGAEVVSGSPLLKEAGLGAARASRFECQGCDGERSYTISYAFKFDGPAAPPTSDQSGSRVEVIGESQVIIPLFANFSVPSAKCLYLWRCGSQWGGREFYNYRVRSARCAWLWKCGWRPRQ